MRALAEYGRIVRRVKVIRLFCQQQSKTLDDVNLLTAVYWELTFAQPWRRRRYLFDTSKSWVRRSRYVVGYHGERRPEGRGRLRARSGAHLVVVERHRRVRERGGCRDGRALILARSTTCWCALTVLHTTLTPLRHRRGRTPGDRGQNWASAGGVACPPRAPGGLDRPRRALCAPRPPRPACTAAHPQRRLLLPVRRPASPASTAAASAMYRRLGRPPSESRYR